MTTGRLPSHHCHITLDLLTPHFLNNHKLLILQIFCYYIQQSWRPRGHILMSLALKSPVLENCPILGLRTAVFFELLKVCTLLKVCC